MVDGEWPPVNLPRRMRDHSDHTSQLVRGRKVDPMNALMTAIGVAAAILVVAPLVAILLVSFASLREESARSLSGAAPNFAARLARRVLGFHGDLPSRPSSVQARTPSQGSGREVRFAYARRTLPNPGQRPAGRQPQPSSVRFGQRQPAGV